MRYRSTRDPKGERAVSLREAVLQGLAPDGGLYLPEEIPTLPPDAIESLRGRPFLESAHLLASHWLAGSLPADTIRALVDDSLDFPVPMVQLGPGLHFLELFHGPTASFKDVGARFLAALLSHLRADSEERIVILVATSGDTGGAVAHAVQELPGVEAVILYPEGRISPLQLRQIAGAPGTETGKVRAVAVRGDFDDCQNLLKAILAHPPQEEGLTLTSANSVNLGRLLPQTFYYAHARAQWDQEEAPFVSVPSGNLGNLTAGVLARGMGVPLAGLLAACNQNRPLSLPLAEGSRGGSHRSSRPTLSSAMDVAHPSNLERLRVLLDAGVGGGWESVVASHASESDTLRSMRKLWSGMGQMVDPHTAVGWAGLNRESRRRKFHRARGILLATAHPGKFPQAVEEAIGVTPIPLAEGDPDAPLPRPHSRIAAKTSAVLEIIRSER